MPLSVRLRSTLLVVSCGLGAADCARAPNALDGSYESPMEPATSASDGAADGATEEAGEGSSDAAAKDSGTTETDRDAGTTNVDPDSGSKPDAGSTPNAPTCKAGTYVGSFSGNISAFLIVNLPISGSITIVADAAATGNALTINNGKISGQDSSGNPVTADVQGTLNCATKLLENGVLKNGVYTRKVLNMSVQFEGTVEATYQEGNPPTVAGQWNTSGTGEMGTGPFNAVLTE